MSKYLHFFFINFSHPCRYANLSLRGNGQEILPAKELIEGCCGLVGLLFGRVFAGEISLRTRLKEKTRPWFLFGSEGPRWAQVVNWKRNNNYFSNLRMVHENRMVD